MKNKTLKKKKKEKSMQPDSRVDNLLLPFHNLCLYVKAGMHASFSEQQV